MITPVEAELLRIFLGENDRYQGRPMYEVVVDEARRLGLAGATVLRGTLGYGEHHRIHTAKVLRLAEDLPLIVEIVDDAQRITAFLPLLENLRIGGLVTLEKVRVVRFSPSGEPGPRE